MVVLIAISVMLIVLGTVIFIFSRNSSNIPQDNPATGDETGGAAGQPQEISKEEYERQAIFERQRESTAPASTAPVIEFPD